MARKQTPTQTGSDWLPTPQAAAALGICSKTLRRRRDEGCLKLGKHYRIISGPQATIPRYQWHVKLCAEFFGTPLEKR